MHPNANLYPFWINFYTTYPSFKITLQEIEDVVAERLKILQIIDHLMKSLDTNKRGKQYHEVMLSQINSLRASNNEKNFVIVGRGTVPTNAFEARKRDHVSHFLLRLYYCQSSELKKWFISRETELFRFRLLESSLTNSSKFQDCLSYYGYNYEIVSTDERVDFHEKINWNETKTNISSIAFKLNFENAIDLIRARKVYLNQGFAYINATEMLSVLCNEFRTNLSKELSKMHTNFVSLDEQRLFSRLNSLHDMYIANSIKKSDQNKQDPNSFSKDQIEQFSKELFPPCMRSIHETLRHDHHLKHYGRLHYGLFLKSAGLSLEDSIDFFRSEMNVHNPEKFQKEYSYTIRYIYGREGKRVQLSAYSCQKIMNGNAPGPNDTHGCPFKHFDTNNLKALLIRYGINEESSLNEIIKMVTEENNISGACSKYFFVKYGNHPKSGTIYHPNQFFLEARRQIYYEETPADISMNDNEANETLSGDTTIDSLNATLNESVNS